MDPGCCSKDHCTAAVKNKTKNICDRQDAVVGGAISYRLQSKPTGLPTMCRRRRPNPILPEQARKREEVAKACEYSMFIVFRTAPYIRSSLHLAEVFPAHPEGSVVVVVLVPYRHLRQTRAKPPHNSLNHQTHALAQAAVLFVSCFNL